MQSIILSRTYCDEHMQECWQSFNEVTNKTECVPSYTEASEKLKESGYYYAGHRAGQYTYTLRKSAPLIPLEWQILAESKQPKYIDLDQDW